MDNTQIESDENKTDSQGSQSESASFLYRQIGTILVVFAGLSVGVLAWRQSLLNDEILTTSATNCDCPVGMDT